MIQSGQIGRATTVLCCMVLAGGLARAAPIVEFGFTGANAGTGPTLSVVKHASGLQATTLNAVGTSGPLDYANTLFYSSWPTAGSGLDKDQYYEFTVTPDEGVAVTYSSVALSLASGGHGEARVELHASTDGFATADILLRAFSYPANTTIHTFERLDITDLGTQTGPVTFRVFMEKGNSGFAGIGNSDAFGGGTNVIVDGVVKQAD